MSEALPQTHPLATYLTQLYHHFSALKDGAVADYIPELSKADPDDFGIVLVTTDGEVYAVGECAKEFTIQSISKAFVYATALADKGPEYVLKKVYVEPTGDAFNSISLHPETGAPLNPMINAGAIATAGLVGGDTPEDQWERIIGSLSAFAGRSLSVDEKVYQSESDTGYRNRAIGWMLRNFGILENDPTPVVENYFRQCSILVNCRDLGIMGATLANGGVNPLTGERVLSPELVGSTLSVMSTCGMYDYAGSWLFEVGLPAKSGVGGGIVAVLPGRFALATYSPKLDAKGNSVRGIETCKAISKGLGLHMMGATRNGSQVISAEYAGSIAPSNRMRPMEVAVQLAYLADRIRILSLQGDLALDGAELVSRRLLGNEGANFAVLDMHRVTNITAPAARLLLDCGQLLKDGGGDLAFSRVRARTEVEAVLKAALASPDTRLNLFPDNDRAVEWCENELLREAGVKTTLDQARVLADFPLFMGLDDADMDALKGHLTWKQYERNQAIVNAGAKDDDRVFLILSGEVSVLVGDEAVGSQRLATLGPGMVFGEMVLLGQIIRSATVRADTDVTCWVLHGAELESICEARPSLRITLLNNLAELLASKLKRSNDMIAALAR